MNIDKDYNILKLIIEHGIVWSLHDSIGEWQCFKIKIFETFTPVTIDDKVGYYYHYDIYYKDIKIGSNDIFSEERVKIRKKATDDLIIIVNKIYDDYKNKIFDKHKVIKCMINIKV